MPKSLIILLITLASLLPGRLFAQVDISIGNYNFCANTYNSIPIVVKNMIGVDSLRIELSVNESVASYHSYFGMNSQLTGGNFTVSASNGKVAITWYRNSLANILNDTLVRLSFYAKSGSTVLECATSASYFYTQAGESLTIQADNGLVDVLPVIKLTLTEINQTCTSKCDANFMAKVVGGSRPIDYKWNGASGRFDSIQTGLCSGANSILIKDANGCELDSLFTVSGLPGADVTLKIECDGDTTSNIYLENPTLTFTLTENYPTHIIEPPIWDFGDGDTAQSFNPTHTYSKAIVELNEFYKLKVYVKNENGCDTIIEQKIKIHQSKLKIPNVIVKNSDKEYNQVFVISDSKSQAVQVEETFIKNQYKRVELVVLDRWGRKVFADSDYQNDWRAENVPDGVYFYTLKTIGFYREQQYQGSITIFGSGVTK